MSYGAPSSAAHHRYGGSLAMDPDGSISVGKLITYQLYYNMMNNSIQALSGILNSFTRAAGSAERVLSVIDLEPDISPRDGSPVDVAVASWNLALSGVVFAYQMRPSNRVLDGLSFEVPEGSVCALVGPSGGGKSTIIHMILRFYDPHEGALSLGGVDLRALHLGSVHARTGTVSQETQLFNDTLSANIAYGCPHVVSDADVEAAARAAQAWDFIASFEDGMQTKVRASSTKAPRAACSRCPATARRLPLRRSVSVGRGSRVGRGRGSQSRAACCAVRSCCCSTRRPLRSTRRRRPRSSAPSTASSGTVATPRSSSHTASPPWSTQTRSSSSKRGRASSRARMWSSLASARASTQTS